jgi:hypothetical protein
MKDNQPGVTPPEPAATETPAALPWFTADEIPLPPPWMRRPPEQEGEPTLFDDLEDE